WEERRAGSVRSVKPGGFHRTAIATAIVVGLAFAAAGCGGSSGIGGNQTQAAPTADGSRRVKGELTISQWPLYIDPGKNGTQAEFERNTGVSVNYIEDIND